MIKFIYTEHAKVRIEQRKLSKEQIEKAVSSPDKILPSFKGRILVQKSFNDEILEVVYKKEQNNFIILTAYWLEEV